MLQFNVDQMLQFNVDHVEASSYLTQVKLLIYFYFVKGKFRNMGHVIWMDLQYRLLYRAFFFVKLFLVKVNLNFLIPVFLTLKIYHMIKSLLKNVSRNIKTNVVRRFDDTTIIIMAKWLFLRALNIK